ncbi:MAG: NADH-dependent flavin oxidoreductase, Oye family protein [Streptococcaceae bacterium]|jgi:2,4-dienoyl-CoA reductase-like NADH-dependent reductase (Old Yellow Enzyme family)|nr:NADH-dependent flavin oxidoreductase, Oye family protein [Streptococcaceae bacterium]
MDELKDILFSPFYSEKIDLKNKLVMNPVPSGFVEDGVPLKENVEFYKSRAKGVGLITAGAINIVHPTASNNRKVPNIDLEALPLWRKVTEAVHEFDTKIIAEIWHAGTSRAFAASDLSRNVSSPSGVIGDKKVGEPLTLLEINDIVIAFAEAAENAKKSGFDGIDIHAAHGSLIHDFLSKETNKRTDEFGFDQRTMFAEKVVNACRIRVGDDFPIFMRLSNFKMYDLTTMLADSVDEFELLIRKLSNSGVDIFDCSEQSYMDAAIPSKKGNLAYWVKRLAEKPTITTGGLGGTGVLYKEIPDLVSKVSKKPKNSYKYAQDGEAQLRYKEQLLKDYKDKAFDLVSFGRPLLINENWIEEMEENL